jgi:nicotinamide-nucleotide amidase
MSFSVSILATGSELLDGRVIDTNSNIVARELSELGLKLKRVLIVDDDRAELINGLKELSLASDLIITSGGLGPTQDDLTREIVAEFFGVALTESPIARAHVEEFYRKRSRALDPANLKQALIPASASVIHNENGTAPGFVISGRPTSEREVTVCSLSGVPREFRPMFNDTVLPIIMRQSGSVARIKRITLRTFGLPESVVGRLIEGCKLSKAITVSYRAAFPEVQVVLKSSDTTELERAAEQAREALSPAAIYSEQPNETLAEKVNSILAERGLTVATAESCTGGMISSLLTDPAGASKIFLGGVVSYDNSIKERLLKVSNETLKQHGAVSAMTVKQMAAEVKALIGTSYGLSISGVAGPTGGSTEKPVGTFFIGVSGPNGSYQVRSLYVNDRRSIRAYATHVALDILRRDALKLPIPERYPLEGVGAR